MNLAITLPSDIQKRVQDIAAQKGERAETVVIAKDLPREQLAAMMEKLSEKVAKGMASTTWQEAEAFMRGEDHYDFARQQYLHH